MSLWQMTGLLMQDIDAGCFAHELYIAFVTCDGPYHFCDPSICRHIVRPVAAHAAQPLPAWRWCDVLARSSMQDIAEAQHYHVQLWQQQQQQQQQRNAAGSPVVEVYGVLSVCCPCCLKLRQRRQHLAHGTAMRCT
jgi:hypothetical protein